tara:strand:- start:12159 stop:13025 length:867 start_codon:yes stop_codon:yes gene_type:complete
MLCIVVLAGCAPRVTTEGMPEGSPPEWSTIVSRWNERADTIESLYARGIFEARWVEEDGGRRFEQGDLDLWYLRADRLATRISKFGETYAVTGMNGPQHWIYLDGEESVLYVGASTSRTVEDFRTIPVDPDFYRVVLGLGHLQVRDEPAVAWDSTADAWRLNFGTVRRGMPSSVWIEPNAMYPVRFEFRRVGSDRRLRVEYDPRRTRAVALSGRPVTSYPQFCNAMTISLHEDDEVRNRSMIVLDQMTTDVSKEPVDRVFDLNMMRRGLNPDREERLRGTSETPESAP